VQAGFFLFLLAALTGLWLAGMVVAGVVWLAPEGALPPLGVRPLGYHPATVDAWLAGLSERGRSVLLGPYRWAETVLVLMLGATLALAGAVLGRRWLSALALVYVVLALAESAAIAAILRAGIAGVDPGMVGRASGLTVGKWAVLLPVLAAVILFALRRRR
jgi:ABC-type amino acid transport system permease subunit